MKFIDIEDDEFKKMIARTRKRIEPKGPKPPKSPWNPHPTRGEKLGEANKQPLRF